MSGRAKGSLWAGYTSSSGRYQFKRVEAGAPLPAAVMEFLAAENLELAGNAAREDKKSRIIPRNDEELNKPLAGVTISQGGVLPNSHTVPKKSQAAAKEAAK